MIDWDSADCVAEVPSVNGCVATPSIDWDSDTWGGHVTEADNGSWVGAEES